MFPLTDASTRVRLFVKRTPALYRPAKRLTGRGAEDHLCDRKTDLCIEGYPSSGNSFSYAVLRLANRGLRIAHHCHSPANLAIALDYGIPAIALIRNPEDAIASRMARFRGSLSEAVLEYVDFYDFVLARIDRLAVVTFEEVTQRTAEFLDHVARASGLPFAVDDVAQLERDAIAYIETWTEDRGGEETISLPTAAREASKARLRASIRAHRRFAEAVRLWEGIAHRRTAAV